MKENSKKALKEKYKNKVTVGGVYCVKCSENKNIWLRSTTDMQSSKNRFAFSVSTKTFPEACMIEAWNQFGPPAFSFEILEEIQKKEVQTEQEFSEDVATLLEIWTETLKARKGENEFGAKK
ncbi:GIY-YIG nuclease family protein [Anaerotignum sp. MB30-C6]|uniref:GIY-YIG nuclease family protein n=1 Tax=Anaerotignum sp. MB30-C6 TaxID=3070814 RepID=UPI0027DC157F|nr:GIY-YIG nuclease family protein [Anaerotignum sp. MB30-C6]WMI79990.1 GIY-YIG nuclease family protein [Anaerotignum sp. MB30-C6]